MNDCIFCKIINKEIPSKTVFENDDVLVIMTIEPKRPGHVLFIPKEHSENLHKASPAAGAKAMNSIQELAPRIIESLGAGGYNLGVNTGAVAGQEVFHTHIHLIPKYEETPNLTIEEAFEKIKV